MNESLMQALVGKTVPEIQELIETSVHAADVRDPEALAVYLDAIVNAG